MTCPVCGAGTEQKWRPFCSKRCADLDLARWLGDGYRIPDRDDSGDEAPAERTDSRSH